MARGDNPPQNTLDGGGSSSANETGNEHDVDILFDDAEYDDDDDEDDEDEDESGGLRTGDEGQALIGGIESARAQLEEEEEGGRDPAPRATAAGTADDGVTTGDVIGKVGDGQAATGGTTLGGGGGGDGLEPWAHRDIKPVSCPRLFFPSSKNPSPFLNHHARLPLPAGQHHARGRQLDSDLDGLRVGVAGADPDPGSEGRTLAAGLGGRALLDAVPRAGTL